MDHPGDISPGNPPILSGAAPENLAPETLAFFQNLIDSFNVSAESLKTTYGQLQQKFERLNLKLEETNRELTRSFSEQERLSNYLTNILESLSSGVLVVDTGGFITLFNRGAETITGILGDAAIDRPYREVMGHDLPDELTPLGVLRTGRAWSHLEKTVVSKNGAMVPVGFSISPLLNATGDLLGAVEIFMDLTRIKQLEDELAWKEKLAALGQMSATMAHKIRNPLGGIAGYASLLEKGLDSDEKSLRQVRKILSGVEKINRIIASVLTYNSALKLNVRELDLRSRVEETAALVRRDLIASDDIRIVFQESETVMVEADPEQFAAALHAVFENAVDAVEGSGTITVGIMWGTSPLYSSNPAAALVLDTVRRSSRLLASKRPCGIVVVSDSGPGMDEITLKNLFVPFYTTKEKGIGLGLALVRKIIEAYQGEVWIESLPGRGTAAALILPERSALNDRAAYHHLFEGTRMEENRSS